MKVSNQIINNYIQSITNSNTKKAYRLSLNKFHKFLQEANIDDIIYPPTEEFTEIKTETDWYTDANNETYVVPKGFAIGKSEGINTVAEGLVITDSVELINGKYYSNGNEFVWIPVRFGEFSRVSFMPRTNHTTNVSSDFVEDEDAAYSEMKYYTENMYRGFYIARYEAGCVTGRTFNGPNTSNLVPLSKKGLYPYNFVTWAEAKAASESMYPKTNEPGDYDVVSTLCYGVQWDSIMRYLKRYDSNIDLVTSYDYGNTYTHGFHYMGKYYYEDHYNNANWEDCNSGWLNSDVNIENNIKSNNVERLLQTGASENNKTKNIYDLLGNVAEQTMECYKVDDDTYEHVTRGGNFIEHGYCMSERDQFSQADYEETCYYGFRPALYIKAEWDYE